MIEVGEVTYTRSQLPIKVLKRENSMVTIKFLRTNNIITVPSSRMCGEICIKDNFEPSIAGIGYIGGISTSHSSPSLTKEYGIWKDIISRCYNINDTAYVRYGKKGVTVDRRWHNFTNFYHDIKQLDGYNLEKFNKGEIHLDKDTKQSGILISQRVYSKNSCVFLSPSKNKGLTTRNSEYVEMLAFPPNDNSFTYKGTFIDFQKQYGIKTQYITRVLKGGAKTHKGWRFKYL